MEAIKYDVVKCLKIKDWSLSDRPREKLLEKGVYSLSNAELLAILINSGIKNMTAVDLARIILNSCNNDLDKLGRLSIAELKTFCGIGEARALTIVSALELARRKKISSSLNMTFNCSRRAYEFLAPYLSEKQNEEFWVLFLTNANKYISKHLICSGGLTGTPVDIRLILKKAINENAIKIILAHNHPSGSMKPSVADMEVTKDIITGANYFDISVVDHIIVSNENYLSFADEGLMQNLCNQGNPNT